MIKILVIGLLAQTTAPNIQATGSDETLSRQGMVASGYFTPDSIKPEDESQPPWHCFHCANS